MPVAQRSYPKFAYMQGLMFLAIAQVMVGINIVLSKSLITDIPIILLLTIRFSFAALILLPLHFLSPARKHSVSYYLSHLVFKDWVYIFFQALTAGILFNLFMLYGLRFTDANVAGIITSALPAIIALMSWFFLGEKISGKKSLCIGFATLGLIIIAAGKLQGIDASHSFWGDFVIFLALIPEATYYILCKMHHNRLPVFLVSAIINLIKSIILLAILFSLQFEHTTINWHQWIILLLIGLSTGFFYVCWFYGCKSVDGVMTSLSTAIMPIATVIFAWIILHETLNVHEYIGMLLVILSIIVYAKR